MLSSGVAGTMAANGSGLQMATIRNMVMAWVLTLPVAIMLSGTLYVLFCASVLSSAQPSQAACLDAKRKARADGAGLFELVLMNR